MTRRTQANIVWALTFVWVAVLLLSLKFGWLNAFFYDTSHAHVQGIDFFPVERGWLNLTTGLSQFDTFHSAYGPYATWLVYHPVLALVIGPLLMPFAPWTAYWVWTFLSLLLMAVAATVVIRRGTYPLRRALTALLFLGAFPTFVVLYSGNVQAVIVLALALIFAAVDAMREQEGATRSTERMLLVGLLLSLFSKPVVLAMFPMLLLVKATRRSALRALAVYAIVSLLTLIVPALNPVAMTWAQRLDLISHPLLMQQTMNVYTNGFVVTPAMQDNAVHWLGMLTFADFRLLHIDVYSLPALLDGLFHTRTPDALYRVAGILVLEVSLLVALIRDRKDQLEAILSTLMAASLILFLSYGLVWEYHYTGILPVAAFFLIRPTRDRIDKAILCLGLLAWAPGLYVLVRHQDAASLSLQTLLRMERVLPVVILFVLLLVRAVRVALSSHDGLRLLSQEIQTTAELSS